MAKYFGWQPDFWRLKPRPLHSMGWREFLAWLKAMRRQREGKKVSPDSWRNADQDAWWVEARRKRDEERRRARGF